jgi:hypothetical protein
MGTSTEPKLNRNKKILETNPYSHQEIPTNKPASDHKTQWETTALTTNVDNHPTAHKTDHKNASPTSE